MRVTELIPIYVEFMPEREDMRDGMIYISKPFELAIHLCACGCGEQTVTPLGPGDWTLLEETGCVTLRPSIGNWAMACKSHYFVTKNKIEWC